MQHAGVNPDVHDVSGFLIIWSLRAEQVLGLKIKPRVDACNFYTGRDRCDEFSRLWMQLTSFLVQKERYRHTPSTLPRNAPIRPIFNHAEDPLLAPGGRPGDRPDRRECIGAQAFCIHTDEPLRRCAKNQWTLMPPAMRVAVLVWNMRHKLAALLQHVDHLLVGIEYLNARK